MIFDQIFKTLEVLLFRHRIAILWAGYAFAAFALLRDYQGSVLTDEAPIYYAISDMLINYADGIIRRGLSGEVAIAMSRWFGGLPWIWAWFLIVAIAGLFFHMAIRLVRRLPGDSCTLPMVLAPWGLLFFAYDKVGSFRKEIVGYLALAVILQVVISGNRRAAQIWTAAGTAIFSIGVFAHEGIVFLLPALMLAYYLAARCWPKDKIWFGACATTSAVLSGAIFCFLTMRPVPDIDLVCMEALFYCNHIPYYANPFHALTIDLEYTITQTIQARMWSDVWIFVSIALLAALPMFGFRIPGVGRRWHLAVILIPIVCMMPLFLIAIDWGRWVQMIFLPLSLIGIAALIAGVAEYRRLLPQWATVAYVSTWSMSHILAEYHFNALYILPVLGLIVLGYHSYDLILRRGIRRGWSFLSGQ